MKIEHLAIWTNQLERLKDFYIKYFDALPNENISIQKNNSILIFFLLVTAPGWN
jgi:lactoylglutathione lyase